MLYNYILSDIKSRSELALTWVYSEYVAYQGFTKAGGGASIHSYEECLTGLLSGLFEKREQPGASMYVHVEYFEVITKSPCVIIYYSMSYCVIVCHSTSCFVIVCHNVS